MSALVAVFDSLWLIQRRGACAVGAICVALLTIGATPARAECGQTIEVKARHSLGPGPSPLAVGDSVLYGAAPVLADYGFTSNAMVCRTMAQGIAWLQERRQPLPVVVVVALGTNGTVTMDQIDALLRIVGPERLLAMVTPHHAVSPGVTGVIRTAAQRHPGQIVVLDWDRLSAGHADWFAPDGIHLGGAAGISAYARLIASVLTTAESAGSPLTKRSAPKAKPAARPTPPRPKARPPKPKARPPRRARSSSTGKPAPVQGFVSPAFLTRVVSAALFGLIAAVYAMLSG